MPERDAFEVRLEAAVRSFAERADAHVDAMAVAERAIRRRHGGFGWLGRTVPVPIAVLLLLALLALGTWSAAVGGLLQFRSWTAPAPAPTSTPPPRVTPSPGASISSVGSSYVVGTASLVVVNAGEATQSADVSQVRGIVITTAQVADDPRATGSGTFQLNVDAMGGLGFEWGTVRIENANGAWEGSCSGASWSDSAVSDITCWLTGSGGYQGLTYYWHGRNAGAAGSIDGTIVPAPGPSAQ